jgi:two-component system LytT family sensor kinase
MFKRFHFKRYFIGTGILITVLAASQLLRYKTVSIVRWWEYPEAAFYIALIILVCWLVHGYFLLRQLSGSKIYARHLLSIISAAVMAFLLTFILSGILPNSTLIENGIRYNNAVDYLFHFVSATIASLIAYVLFYSIHTSTALHHSQLENELLEQSHLRAQLISLQQQISPHFLFNSLSTLKTLATDQPTKNYIIQLANVYRYVLNFNEYYLTPLKDELTFINSYLYIMNERFEDALLVSINISEEHLTYLIPPLSVQLLIENAIKHNTISPENPLHITILSDDSPQLIVTNNLQLKRIAEESTGTGLKNISQRYKLLVDKPIQINNNGAYFSVHLPLVSK